MPSLGFQNSTQLISQFQNVSQYAARLASAESQLSLLQSELLQNASVYVPTLGCSVGSMNPYTLASATGRSMRVGRLVAVYVAVGGTVSNSAALCIDSTPPSSSLCPIHQMSIQAILG
jgi:hypothetical protein